MLIIISILLACVLILVGVLQLWSPGKPKPFVDENGSPLAGSISEKIFVNINGVEQGMFIKSKDATIRCCFTFMGVCLITSLQRNTRQVLKTISLWSGGNSVVQESPTAPTSHPRR